MKPLIDLDHLDQYVMGDNALLDEILTIFTDQATRWLGALDPMLEDEKWGGAAHTLKGASRGIGSWAIADLCERAETLVGGAPEKMARRQAVLSELRVRIDAAKAEAQRLRETLQQQAV
jgi:HPt (histidine-containing phosphotransfer) domain-containing protein